jgi:hypothetical protein
MSMDPDKDTCAPCQLEAHGSLVVLQQPGIELVENNCASNGRELWRPLSI